MTMTNLCAAPFVSGSADGLVRQSAVNELATVGNK